MSIGKMTLAERIRHVRKIIAGLTMEEFAARIGISASAISLFENGKANPSSQTLRSICREFGVSEEWLVNGVGDVAPPSFESELEKLVKERGLYHEDYIAIRNYMALPQKARNVVTKFMIDFVYDLRPKESYGDEPEEILTREQEAERVGEAIKREIRNGGEKASESGQLPEDGAGIA